MYPSEKLKNEDLIKYLDGNQLSKLLIACLEKIQLEYKNARIIIFLDSIDQLNSKDLNLNWFMKEYPSNTKVIFSTLTDYCEIIETISSKGIPDDCFLKIDDINDTMVKEMYDRLMNRIGRKLANVDQCKAVEELFNSEFRSVYPLYVKLIFDITKNWYSFTPVPNEFSSLTDTNDAINFIFETIEDDYGQLLVSRCLFYLTLNNQSGISDCEMEDVLSLDTELLDHLFEMQKSPNRRFPITLWNRIKLNLKDYLTFKEVDETPGYSW